MKDVKNTRLYRRKVLKSIGGIGIGAPILLGNTVKASYEDPFQDYPGIDCYDGMECPSEVIGHEWQISESSILGGFDTYGSCTFLWYGSFYSDDIGGYLHGVGFGGAAQSDSPVYQVPGYNLAGQRYRIEMEENEPDVWSSAHKHGVYPPEGESEHWAGYILEAIVESSLSSIDFNYPINTLIDMLSSHDGIDYNDEIGYGYSNSIDPVSGEGRWSECAHTDTVLIMSESPSPGIEMRHSYRIDESGLGYWENAEYTLSSFGGGQGPVEIYSLGADEKEYTNPPTVHPSELGQEEKERWGIKPVDTGDEMSIQTTGEGSEIKPDYIITKNPFVISDFEITKTDQY